MTQCMIEPRRFPLPAEWTVTSDARRAARDDDIPKSPRRQRRLHTVLLALCVVLVSMQTAQAQSAATAPADVAADLRMTEDAAPMRAAAEHFTARAMAGNQRDTLAMLSPALVSRLGRDNVAQAMQTQIVPFFQRGRGIGRSTTITRTTDAAGHSGFAFYQWLEMRDGSPARPFTVYVVREDDRVVVANIVPDRLVEGRHR
jgi:hypothetical protein